MTGKWCTILFGRGFSQGKKEEERKEGSKVSRKAFGVRNVHG
ncbi:hypothetical protein NARC_10331 [Candidatus Nitrosocosmicus arcticus]|uniref:Uncharacterized protein n=1 Tax=Candidatus Nitrosocosmicus arcticus TaxID=2035267 RepID=A0A557SZB4_9ARCH|nr:hypothetical protein NARC_10331 [Candidatus Nitrosocosmicus arcticus]